MGQQLKPYLESARRLWASLSPGRRIGLLVTFGLGVALVLAIVNWVQNPDYAILYRGLAESDAAAVTTKLKELGVPYRLEDGGGTILVPAAQVPDVRLQLAAAGLPQNGGGGVEAGGGGEGRAPVLGEGAPPPVVPAPEVKPARD